MQAPGGAKPKTDRQALDAAQAAATLAELGEAIRRHRTAQGLSQTALARLAGIPQPKLPPIESGQGNPTLSTLLRIGRALGLKLVFVPIKEAEPGG